MDDNALKNITIVKCATFVAIAKCCRLRARTLVQPSPVSEEWQYSARHGSVAQVALWHNALCD